MIGPLEQFVQNYELKGIVVYNQRLDFVECNKSFRNIFLDFTENNLSALLQQIEKENNYLSQLIMAIETGQESAECTLAYDSINGRKNYNLRLTVTVCNGSKFFVCTFEDITEFLFLQSILSHQTDNLETLNGTSLAAVYRASVDGKVLYVNRGLVSMLDYSNERELYSLEPYQVWASISDREKLLQLLKTNNSINGFETRWRNKNNEIFWVSLAASCQYSPNNEISSFEVVAINVNEKKEAEIELQHLQNHLHNMVESKTIELQRANDLLLKEVSIRQRAESIYEILHSLAEKTTQTDSLNNLLEFIHNKLSSIIHAPNLYFAFFNRKANTYSFPYSVDQNDPVENFADVKLMKGSLTDYVRVSAKPLLVNKDGISKMEHNNQIRLVGSPCEQWMGVPLKDSSGVWGVLVVQSYTMQNVFSQSDLLLFSNLADNISMAISQYRAEQARKKIEALYNTVVDNLQQGVIMCDPEDNILFANKAFSNIVKIPPDILTTMNISELIPKKEVGRTASVRELRSIGERSTYHLTLIRKDGERINVSVSGIPNFESDNVFQGTIGLFEIIEDMDDFIE